MGEDTTSIANARAWALLYVYEYVNVMAEGCMCQPVIRFDRLPRLMGSRDS